MTAVPEQSLTRRTLIALAVSLLGPSPGHAAAPPAPRIRLRRGINLWPWFSLTREFPAPRIDYDWPPFQADRPVPRPSDLKTLRKAGLDFVRIPVDPGPLLATSGERHQQLIREVLAAAELANGQDLSVIVNLHPNLATHHWNAENLAGRVDAPLFTNYLRLVSEVAAALSRFDPARVCLEPLNEPTQACGSVDWTIMQSELVRAARAVAPDLTLVVSGACGAMIDGLERIDPAQIGDDNVIYTFHFYEPYVFSHQGAPWMQSEPMYRYLTAVPWPVATDSRETTLAAVAARLSGDRQTPLAEKARINAEIHRVLAEYFAAKPDRRFIEGFFARVAAWTERHGIPRSRVLLGEFGALRTDARYVAAGSADRARYIRDVREVCEAAGMPWAFWNLFDGMGLVLDDRTRELDPMIVAALGLDRASHR
jgi:hypothetical protein